MSAKKKMFEVLEGNGDKLVYYNQGQQGHKYIRVFDYSVANGGIINSASYYNKYYVDITSNCGKYESMGFKIF